MKKNIFIISVCIILIGVGGWAFMTGNVSENTIKDTSNNIQNSTIITASHDGFQVVPDVITVKAGVPYVLEITPESHGRGCMSTIKMQGVDPTPRPVVAGETITFQRNSLEPGSYQLVCNGMEMLQGTVVVEA